MSRIESVVRKRSVIIYFVLVCAISWIGIFVVRGADGFTGRVPATDAQLPFMFLAMYAGPVVASILVTILAGGKTGLRALFAGFLKWRVNVRWYAVAILSAPVLTLTTYFGLSLISSRFLPRAGYLASVSSSGFDASLVVIAVVSGIATGFCEELGWTGLAIPGLRARHGIVATGITVGMVWGLWHFPLFLEKDPAGAVPYLLLVAVRLFTHLPAFRVLMVWVYDRSGSPLIAMLMHAGLTAGALLIQPRSAAQLDAVVINLVLTALLWTVVAVVTFADTRLRSRQAQSEACHGR